MDPVTALVIAFSLAVVSYAISTSLIKTPQPQPPASLEEFSFPQFEEGTPQAVVFGDCWTPGWQVLWYGNLRSTPIKKKAGGKK